MVWTLRLDDFGQEAWKFMIYVLYYGPYYLEQELVSSKITWSHGFLWLYHGYSSGPSDKLMSFRGLIPIKVSS